MSAKSELGWATQIRIASLLPPEAARALLAESLLASPEDDAMLVWLEEAFRLDARDAKSGPALAEELACHLTSRSLASLRKSFFAAFLLLERASPAHVARGFDWICANGKPGDAAPVAELMLRWSADGPQTFYTLRRFANVTGWLLDNGRDALRSRDFTSLLPFLVDVARHHLPDRVEVALRCIASNEQGASVWTPGFADILWEALELMLGRRREQALTTGWLPYSQSCADGPRRALRS